MILFVIAEGFGDYYSTILLVRKKGLNAEKNRIVRDILRDGGDVITRKGERNYLLFKVVVTATGVIGGILIIAFFNNVLKYDFRGIGAIVYLVLFIFFSVVSLSNYRLYKK